MTKLSRVGSSGYVQEQLSKCARMDDFKTVADVSLIQTYDEPSV